MIGVKDWAREKRGSFVSCPSEQRRLAPSSKSAGESTSGEVAGRVKGVRSAGESMAVSLGVSRPVAVMTAVGRSSLSGAGGDVLVGDTNEGRRMSSPAHGAKRQKPG